MGALCPLVYYCRLNSPSLEWQNMKSTWYAHPPWACNFEYRDFTSKFLNTIWKCWTYWNRKRYDQVHMINMINQCIEVVRTLLPLTATDARYQILTMMYVGKPWTMFIHLGSWRQICHNNRMEGPFVTKTCNFVYKRWTDYREKEWQWQLLVRGERWIKSRRRGAMGE